MLTVGIDAHRQTLSVVVVDERGQERAHWKVRSAEHELAELLLNVEAVQPERPRQWGIEGSGHAGWKLAQVLVGQDEVVYEVNPRLTAASRNRSRRRDKSDHADALAIARRLLLEADELPRIQPEDATTPLAILTRERARLQVDLTRNRNRLHADLVVFDPAYARRVPKLTSRAGLAAILTWDAHRLGRSDRVRLHAIQRLVQQMCALMDDIETVSTQLKQLSRPVCEPLTQIVGVGDLHAAMLAGYLGPGSRFATDAQLASYTGVAPLEVSSADRTRHRLNRTGHRKLNEIIHRIALVQSQHHEPAKRYLARRQAEGKSWREALRALKRYIVRTIWQAWKQCLTGTALATVTRS